MTDYRRFLSIGSLWLALLPVALAQREPRIGYVYPAGGRQGTSFEVVLGGQYLAGVTQAEISGAGVQTVVIEQEEPLSNKQLNTLRERFDVLRKKEKDMTADERKELIEIRQKLAAYEKRRANPILGETVSVQITIAPDAPPGDRELRLVTATGLSNPLVFQISQLPEFRKSAPKAEDNLMMQRSRRDAPQKRKAEPPLAITLPAVVNGQIPPGGADRFRFPARRGQSLVVAVNARALIPYLADAVPGWFQATVALFDAQGKELAREDDYRFHPDPVLFYVIPQDGEYQLEIRDALYRGRDDFIYRISIGELPFVTSIFPLGGRVGSRTAVEFTGWNLPQNRLTLDFKETGTYPLAVRAGELWSNRIPLAVDTLPELFEKEPNNAITNAQPVKLPVIINGRIDRPNDTDVFRLDGKAGDAIVAEVYARRLDSPLDSVLRLTDAAGKQLAFNDDNEDKGSGLNTHHADSYLRVTFPADGAYYVHLADTQHQGGPAYAYRLRLSTPQPDFALRVAPSSLSARGGGSVPLTVFAVRRDGFTNAITLALTNVPPGFQLGGAEIPANQDQIKLTLTARPASTNELLRLRLEGRAMLDGREIVRPAVPADDMMQAFAYRHLVPAQSLEVAVIGRAPSRPTAKILTATPLKIVPGTPARLQLSVTGGPMMGPVEFELADGPDGITIQHATPTEIVFQTDAAKLVRGQRGNLIIKIVADRSVPPGSANKRRITLGSLPAVPFDIVENEETAITKEQP